MKYIFTVICQPQMLREVSKFMQDLDLIMSEICIEYIFTINSKDEDPEFCKKIIQEILESDGVTVLKIEGEKFNDKES